LAASFRPEDQVVVLRGYLRQRQMLIGIRADTPGSVVSCEGKGEIGVEPSAGPGYDQVSEHGRIGSTPRNRDQSPRGAERRVHRVS
jgi:hypothetical protein